MSYRKQKNVSTPMRDALDKLSQAIAGCHGARLAYINSLVTKDAAPLRYQRNHETLQKAFDVLFDAADEVAKLVEKDTF